MQTAITLHQSNSGVLARIGTPDERQYLIQIMAEQIGIPSRDAERTDVVALLGAAAQRTIQFGWIPGLHMHVQRFETSNSKKNREKNPNASPVYSYTLVVGEKAYKDSGTRWRERGVNWRYQRKAMAPEEVAEEARLQGFTDRLPPHAYGIWSRIIVLGQDDPQDEDDPLWSAGIWIGKIKTGKYWSEDALPTGVSSRDVAIRRADKRAMMQSQLTLLPVDDLGADERVQQLVHQLRREAAERQQPPMLKHDEAEVEEDGDVLWAKTSPGPTRPAVRPAHFPPAAVEDAEFSYTDDVDFSRDVVAEPSPEEDAPADDDPGARPAGARPDTSQPEPSGARPVDPGARINTADAPCPECHAPVGKMHATSCPALGHAGARPEASEAGARPAGSGARPDAPGARPQTFQERFMARLLAINPKEAYSQETAEFVRKARNADHDSTTKMTGTYFASLKAMLHGAMRFQDGAHTMWVLSLLLGYEVDDKTRPGQLVHGYLMKPLREDEEGVIKLCGELWAKAHDLHELLLAQESKDAK